MRGLATFVCWALFGAIAFAAELNSDLIQTSGKPSDAVGRFYGYRTASESDGPGNDAFAKAKAEAESRGVPLVVVWSHESCSHCRDFIDDLNLNSSDVKKWMTENQAVFTFFKATGYNSSKHDDEHAAAGYGYTSPKACLDAWAFVTEDCEAEPSWPLFGFYYKPAKGEPAYGCNTIKDEKSFETLRDDYAAFLEQYKIFGYKGGMFAEAGTEFNRYEAETNTCFVDVRLVRDVRSTDAVWTNLVELTWPNAIGETISSQVVWTVDMSNMTVRLPLGLKQDKSFPAGQKLPVRIYADQTKGSGVKDECFVHCVAKENAASNPLWIGERTADTLGWGEWTMDLDVATQKVASAGGYTLVGMQGSQWCPDCGNVEQNFLDLTDEGGNRFAQWAESHHVTLVTIDIPNFGKNVGGVPDVEGKETPTLLKREARAGAPDGKSALRSGLGYLSRKMVSDADAAVILERNHDLARLNTGAGGFHRPEDTNVYRTGVPIFVILRKDGTVAARFTRWAASSPKAADQAKFDDFLKRFDELLAIAAENGDHADRTEIENNHPNGAIRIAGNGGIATNEICNADFQDAFELVGSGDGTSQQVVLSGQSDAKVTVTFKRKRADGGFDEKVAQETRVISSAEPVECRFAGAGTYFVQIAGSSITDVEFDAGNAKPMNFHAFELRTFSILEPVESVSTNRAPVGSKAVKMRIEPGARYRIEGIEKRDYGSKLAYEEDDIYVAAPDIKSKDTVELEALTEGGEIVFQIWRPGSIRFNPQQVQVIEYAGWGAVTVVRENGSSGAVRIGVKYVSGAGTDEGSDDPRYSWVDKSVEWADGESGPRQIRFPITPNRIYDTNKVFTVKLEAEGTCHSEVSSGICTVTVRDSNLPCLEQTVYALSANLNFETALGFNAYNISNANPTISVVAKSGTIPSGLSFSYSQEKGQFVLSGAPSAEGTYEFMVSISEKRNGRTVSTESDFRTTISVTVVNQSKNNPKLAEGRLNTSMPIYYEIGNGTNVIEGSLRFAITSTGKISAKYSGTEGASLSFAGNWLTIDGDGTVSNRLEATADSAAKLSMTMDAEGHADLVLDLPNRYSHFKGEGDAIRLVAESDWPDTTVDFTRWKGTYNVTFPSLCGTPTNVPTGTGFLSLRMESGLAAKSGLVIVAGVLPDGTSVSGSCQMLMDRMFEGDRFNTAAYLPIFRRTGCSCFSAAAEIGRDGSVEWDKKNWADDRNRLWREIVYPVEGTMAMSLYRDAAWEYLTLHDVCGSYYVPGVSPYYVQTNFNYEATLFANFAVSNASASARYGQIEFPAEKVELAIDDAGIDFAESVEGLVFGFNPQTGIFHGAARLSYNDGQKEKIVSGYYRGVLLPGWIDCNCGRTVPIRPYGSGTFYFKDIINKKIVNRSFPVDLDK